ncbi:Csu type fimbrial protein [Acinetobacter nematophilus]|uniref:Spore coat U domain-containing protein n=1 Tax=Acinetobacter nematophilus TaxID=2994642 RepID=A0A9X3IIU3_9GAMM|nr:spore coat U domain-containing protein [Acinetobacter nematophilus]MCX5468624.1 spore coat U domain-containing protein [Acinetobacter nematophilus]
MNILKKLTLTVFLGTGFIATTQAAVTGQVDVKLNVSTGCTVEGSQVAGNINQFGTLDFGKTSGNWANILTAQVASSATGSHLNVKCDGTTPVDFTVAIDGGTRGDRSLKNTAGTDLINYNVYRDAARSNLYAVNTPQAFTATVGASQQVPIFGVIAANNGTAKAQGDYQDTLLVTVNF